MKKKNKTCSNCGKEIIKKIYFPYKKTCGCGREFLICDKNIAICPYCYADIERGELGYREKRVKGRGFDYWLYPKFRCLRKFLRLYPQGFKVIQEIESEAIKQGYRVFRYGIDYSFGKFINEVARSSC